MRVPIVVRPLLFPRCRFINLVDKFFIGDPRIFRLTNSHRILCSLQVMVGSAAVGAVIVGMIEVASLAVGKFAGMVLDPNAVQQHELEDPAILNTKQQQKYGNAGSSSASSVSGDASAVPFSLAQPY